MLLTPAPAFLGATAFILEYTSFLDWNTQQYDFGYESSPSKSKWTQFEAGAKCILEVIWGGKGAQREAETSNWEKKSSQEIWQVF